LDADEKVLLRRSFKLVLGMFGTLAVLHFGAAASVLPYVWVGDEAANCGARLVLARTVDQMMLVTRYMVAAGVCYTLLLMIDQVWGEYKFLQKIMPPLRQPGRRLGGYALSSSVLMSVCVLAMLGVLINEVRFLENPPPLPSDVGACAHPAVTTTWK
jgi:hypothetical protein